MMVPEPAQAQSPSDPADPADPDHFDPFDNPFRSFWMGGYEGADHINGFGVSLDMADGNGHVAQLEADHARAAALGIRTVRETIGWRLCEIGGGPGDGDPGWITPDASSAGALARPSEPANPSGRFDLSRTRRIAASAKRHGLQVLWTLMHYGTPADVSLLDDSAIGRFARFAAAVAETLAPLSDEAPIYNLVNEISFLAWAVSKTNMVHPYRGDPVGGSQGDSSSASGYDVKRRLVRMALAGIAAVRAIDPRARFLHVEPLVHVVAPRDRPELAALAEQISDYQWQAWDMLSGRTEPELGGEPRALDLIGINHYHSSQWEAATEERLWWHLRDARRRPLGSLLETAWERYRRPMMVAETSHFGEGRAQWLNELAAEVERVRATRRLPVHGICLYPLIDRPDWGNPTQWHHSGLWDVDSGAVGGIAQRRILCGDYAAALQRWQTRLPMPASTSAQKPVLLVFSHLRWGFVHHRPQQLMTRLASRFQVIFVEEPLPLRVPGGSARLDCVSHGPDIDVLIPRTPIDDDPTFSDAQLALLAPLLAAYLGERGLRRIGSDDGDDGDDRVDGNEHDDARDAGDARDADKGRGADGRDCTAWFYTPMAEPLLALLPIRLIVYDCIDEMAAFVNAAPQLPARERALLAAADLVLASGPELQQSKRRQRADVECLPNGVDAAHFRPSALDFGSAQASEARQRQGPSRKPRFGYCGVIDERIDLGLLDSLALAHPEWDFMMAGPVVKIDPASLPVRPNIRWLGHQPYVRLPYLIASWDVCLIPFAVNDITRFVNPTKTLEYLAAEKPVVATRLPDLNTLYGGLVRTALGHAAFLAACEEALDESAGERESRVERARALVGQASWDERVETIVGLLTARSLDRKSSRPPG